MNGARRVAPFTGAWIEIEIRGGGMEFIVESHPSRVRGLKLIVVPNNIEEQIKSHPSRVRGLKSKRI